MQGVNSPLVSIGCRIISILKVSEILDGMGNNGNEADNALALFAVKLKKLELVLNGGPTNGSSQAAFHGLHQFLVKVVGGHCTWPSSIADVAWEDIFEVEK